MSEQFYYGEEVSVGGRDEVRIYVGFDGKFHNCVKMGHEENFKKGRAFETGGWYKVSKIKPQYKPIPTEWAHDWARWRAVDSDGFLHEYSLKPYFLYDTDRWHGDGVAYFISDGHDPTNWENSLEERHIPTVDESIEELKIASYELAEGLINALNNAIEAIKEALK